jgi:tetratricopeptide (TPR) repeat protein
VPPVPAAASGPQPITGPLTIIGPPTLIALPAIALGLALLLAWPGAQAQAPLQSSLAPTELSRPQDNAQAALRAGNAQQALDIADTALKAFPHDAQLRFIRAVALNALGRLPEAEAAFSAITREFPELPEPYNNLAVVRAAQGKLDQARVALEEAIRAVPGYAVAHENLGDVYAQLAARSYRAAQNLDPASKSIPPKLKLVSEVPLRAAAPVVPAGPR